MKTSEAIIKYQDEIKSTMIEKYRSVLNCNGSIQYKVYVWEDGNIECLEGTQGDNTYLVPKDPDKNLFYVCTVSAPYFDPWDYTDHSAPDNETERETERQEIIEYLVNEYESNISDIIDTILDGIKYD